MALGWRRAAVAVFGVICLVLLVVGLTVKPVRIYFPERFGLTCVSDTLCLEDATRVAEAQKLTDDATAFVTALLGTFEASPKILMCDTRDCFESFGNPEVAALYFWGAGTIVVNEVGWEPHILRHELIHHWQAETFGGPRAALRLPRWYIEGMAYVLSDDPRPEIPHPTAEAQRRAFEDWRAAGHSFRTPPQ